MERICEELDEAKAEIDKLRGDLKSKSQLFHNLKISHNEQLLQLQAAQSKIELQTQEINGKGEEIEEARNELETIQRKLNEKESVIRGLSSANDKLRLDTNDKFLKWEEEKQHLMLSLDEANEKNSDQDQKINVLSTEIEGLKGLLSASEKKRLEAEKQAKAANALRDRDDVVMTLEEEKMKVEDKLKWKIEQFKHLEEAHEKVRCEFKESKKEWHLEKSTLVDEISKLQSSLDSQTRISQDLKNQLSICNHALANEESRRKQLEVEVAEFRTRFENVYTDYQDAKSQLECLTIKRDNEIAALRHSLVTKETHWKETEYQSKKLDQENRELLESLKELREAQIHEAGNGSSLVKLKNKLRSVEQIHRECAANLRAKEAEWSSQIEKLTAQVTSYQSALDRSETVVRKLEVDLENCQSALMQMKLQKEETAIELLVLKSGVTEAQSYLRKAATDEVIINGRKRVEVSCLMKQLEMKNTVLTKAQTDIEEERRKVVSLLKRLETLELVEEQNLLMVKEVARWKEMLEESSRSHFQFKEQALQTENDLKQKIKAVCDDLDLANSELIQEREKVVSLSRTAEAIDRVEEKLLFMEKEVERHKQMLEKSYDHQHQQEEKALGTEKELQEMIRQISSALDETTTELADEREKAASLSERIESISVREEQKLAVLHKEIQKQKEMFEESFRLQQHQQKEASDKENRLKQELKEARDALDCLTSELAVKMCDGNALEFELWIWKSVAQRLNDDLEENQTLRRDLEASLLSQVDVTETIKQEKCCLMEQIELLEHSATMGMESQKQKLLETLIEKDKVMEDLEEETLRRELEGVVFTHIMAERRYKDEKEKLLQLLEEINLLHDKACEKIAAGEIVAQLEIEEKMLMIGELEDEICSLQRKLESQETSSSVSLEEMKQQMTVTEDKLRSSEVLVHELKSEKRGLTEDVMKLTVERENLLSFLEGVGKRISQFSAVDMQLMQALENIVVHKTAVENEDLKENSQVHPWKRFGIAGLEEKRSPFKELNNN
ncbi:Uncharacterized protein At4g38062 [Linum perenne]